MTAKAFFSPEESPSLKVHEIKTLAYELLFTKSDSPTLIIHIFIILCRMLKFASLFLEVFYDKVGFPQSL